MWGVDQDSFVHAEWWEASLANLGKAVAVACGEVASAAPASKSTALETARELIRTWKDCSRLHALLLVKFKGTGAADPLAAQWAESAGLAAVGRCLDIIGAAGRWDDGLWSERAEVLNICCSAVADFLAGGAR